MNATKEKPKSVKDARGRVVKEGNFLRVIKDSHWTHEGDILKVREVRADRHRMYQGFYVILPGGGRTFVDAEEVERADLDEIETMQYELAHLQREHAQILESIAGFENKRLDIDFRIRMLKARLWAKRVKNETV